LARHEPHSSQGAAERQQDRDRLLRRAGHARRGRLAGPQGDWTSYAYTADLAQPDEETPSDIPPVALQHGAKAARLVDCRDALVREGCIAIQCGAFTSAWRAQVLQHHAARPRGHHHAIVRAMNEDGVDVFSDGSTHKGNDIQRFYRYGVLTNPSSPSTSPGWIRSSSRRSAAARR
jgi:argininosuccinate synthase